MVAGTHPDDIELFDFVEDDLRQVRRDEVAAHLATCSVCTEQIRRVEAGRAALAETEYLHLPKDRHEAILRSLPERRRAEGESRAFSPKVALVLVTVFIAVAAVVGAFVNSNHGSGDESSAGGGVAGATSGGGTKEGAAQVPEADLLAGGSAAAIAEELREKGFRAVVQADRVVVHGATKQQVREALADRGPGDVEVVVKAP
jgi:anti-sigma factor RsiW